MLSVEDKQNIYTLLSNKLEFGLYPMSLVAQLLNDNNHSCRRYGYSKLKALLLDLPEYIRFIEGTAKDPLPQVRFFNWKTPKHANKTPPHKSAPNERTTMPNHPHRLKAICTPQVHPQLNASTDPDSFIPYCLIDPKLSNLLSLKSNRAVESIPAMIEAGYQQAKATGLLHKNATRLTFGLDQLADNGQPIVLTFKRLKNEHGHYYFVLQYIDDSGISTPRASVNIPSSDNPGHALEKFAFLGNWNTFLSQLADMSLPEEWDFADSPQKHHYILKKYIQYTFYRLQLENKIVISSDRRLAAFNTGLVDPHYDHIYACFIPNLNGTSPWLFKEFTLAGQRGLGKQLVNRFNPLPQAASYFSRKEDLLYDLNKDLHCDYDHIILENLERFPLTFLRNQFYDAPQALHLLNVIERRTQKMYQPHLYDELQDYLRNSLFLYNRLKNRLDDAIEIAKKQVRWNFKVAIASYYPARNTMNLMLPLQLCCEGVVDNVLVVELTPSGNYQGQTLLTMEQAYIDARLVCYPGNNWLTTSSVKNATCIESIEDL